MNMTASLGQNLIKDILILERYIELSLIIATGMTPSLFRLIELG